METNKKQIIKIIITIASIVVVAVLGSLFVNLGMDWFNSLNKPSQWIPNIVIPIVWTIIYLTYAIVLFFWIKNYKLTRNIIIALIVNGILNVLWCLVFFTVQQTFLGLIIIILNLIASYLLFFIMYKEQKLYSIFTFIYPIWLSLATTLNLAIWILN